MKQTLLANRYARAFVRASLRGGEAPEWHSGLKSFSDLLLQTPLLYTFLSNPGIPFVKKKELVEKCVGVPVIQRLIFHLVLKNRLELLSEMICRTQELLDEEEGVVRVMVRSVSPLSFEQKQELIESLKNWMGRTVLIEETTDPQLLAGIVVRVGDTILDNSLKGQLQLLEHLMCSRR